MGDRTGIEWTDATWNPIRGCSRVSEGCRNCYAERVAARFSGPGQPYEGMTRMSDGRWNGTVRVIREHLADPLRWNRPRRIFVNSMSDLFHEALTNEQIAAVFGVMAAAPQHTFQVLTKRARRMREWFAWLDEKARSPALAPSDPSNPWWRALVCLNAAGAALGKPVIGGGGAHWPLANVWLGVSVENQAAADERIHQLLATPAAVRFLSCEPLIGPVDLAAASPNARSLAEDLDWVIAGCESGPGARPCDVVWLRSLRDQCVAARIPYFLKQATATPDGDQLRGECGIRSGSGSTNGPRGLIKLPYLDGEQWAQFPGGAK